MTRRDAIKALVAAYPLVRAPLLKAVGPYTYWRTITLNPAKLPVTPVVNFPVLIAGIYPFTKPVASGGEVQNSIDLSGGGIFTPCDLIFSLDPCGTMPLAFEIERWEPTTGELVAWVKLASVSSGAPPLFYILTGNAAVVTDQSNPTAVWDAGYQLVGHMGSQQGSLSNYKDSTVNNHATATATISSDSASKVDGGLANRGNQALAYAMAGFPFGATNRSFECWVWFNDFSNYNSLWQYGDISGAANKMQFLFANPGTWAYAGTYSSGNALIVAAPTPTGTWLHVVATYDGATARLYINGVLVGSAAEAWNTTNTGNFSVSRDNTLFAPSLNGKMDEMRVSTTVRNLDWIVTNYNTQNDPSSFYTLGGQQSGDCHAVPVVNSPATINYIMSDNPNFGQKANFIHSN